MLRKWGGLYCESAKENDLQTRKESNTNNRKHSVKQLPEVYLQLCQTSMIEPFAKIVHGFQPLTVFVKSSIFDVWRDFEYAFGYHRCTFPYNVVTTSAEVLHAACGSFWCQSGKKDP